MNQSPAGHPLLLRLLQDVEFSAQEKSLAWIPKVSAFLSICGSSFIMYDVMIRTAGRTTHDRLLLGMSACDFVVSLAFFMSTWAAPEEEHVYLAAGNQATCDAQGFFAHLSIAVVLYNGSLSFFYLASIRFQVSAERIQQTLEPLLHLVPLAGGLGTSLAGIFLNLYASEGWVCWITKKPRGCIESWKNNGVTTCERGDNSSVYRWVLYYGILWIVIVAVLINMVLVYRSVYRQEHRMARYSFEYKHEKEKIARQHSQPEQQESDDESSENEDGEGSEAPSIVPSAVVASVLSHGKDHIDYVRQLSSTLHSRRKEQRLLNRHFKRSRQVATQGYWFCGAFFGTWTFPTISRFMTLIGRTTPFPLVLLTAFFVPVQGFFNFFVYIQPRMSKWYTDESRKSSSSSAQQRSMDRFGGSSMDPSQDPTTRVEGSSGLNGVDDDGQQAP